MFDKVILIDQRSTDRGCQLIRELAPSNWEIRSSLHNEFDALLTDTEVRDVERSFPDDMWKVVLTVTEFLIWPTMKEDLAKATVDNYVLRANNVVDSNDQPQFVSNTPLIQQRHRLMSGGPNYSRIMHRHNNQRGHLYAIGRHSMNVPHTDSAPAMNAYLFKYFYSPWPECIPRKLQIGSRQSARDIHLTAGYQHQVDREKLEQNRQSMLTMATIDTNSKLNISRIMHAALCLPWSQSVSSL